MDYFANKVALITGSARGIGFATARELGGRGAKIALSDLTEDALAEAKTSLEKDGVEVFSVKADVTDPEQCRLMVEKSVERFGKLHILINNAGVSIVDYFENCSPETCKKLMDVNLMGCIYMTLAAIEQLKKNGGQIVFVSSVSGIRAIPTGSMYSASKAALRSMAESIRLELEPYGVHVGVITPGFTTTDPRKTVMKGSGVPRPIDRPPHDTPEGVARGIAKLLEKRKREIVLTPMGKVSHILQRISPSLLDRILKKRELKN